MQMQDVWHRQGRFRGMHWAWWLFRIAAGLMVLWASWRLFAALRERYARGAITHEQLVERRACVEGEEVHVTSAEFGILERLLLDAEHLVTREALMEALWAPENDPGSNALEVHLGHLRKKLRPHDGVVGIDTVRGRSYVLKARKATTGASAA